MIDFIFVFIDFISIKYKNYYIPGLSLVVDSQEFHALNHVHFLSLFNAEPSILYLDARLIMQFLSKWLGAVPNLFVFPTKQVLMRTVFN